MFSTSMIASSTTSPIAITSPAMTIVLSVAPMAVRTSVAATSDRAPHLHHQLARMSQLPRNSRNRIAALREREP